MRGTTLTVRETRVLSLIAEGKTTKEISADLGIAESTVNWHVANVLMKLEASSRAEAVASAVRLALLPAGGDARISAADAADAGQTTRVADINLLGLALGSVTIKTRTRQL